MRGRINAGRALLTLVGLITGPTAALAVPVTWEARGVVESSSLSPVFLATFMPEIAGTQSNDELLLRISFDTDAQSIREESLPDGGTVFLFDASSLVLELAVSGRGTHVFTIDDTIPPDKVLSFVALFDDRASPDFPTTDSLQFLHQYYTITGLPEFTISAVFSSADTSVISGASLPLVPDPRFSAGVERQIAIADPDGDILIGAFSALVKLPATVPEPGSYGLLALGLALLYVTRRTKTLRCR